MNKKNLLLALGAALALPFALPLAAQDFDDDVYVEPEVLEDVYLFRMSPAGTAAAGQDGLGAFTIGYDVEGKELFYYPACFPGDGNCISDNCIIAGQEMQRNGLFAAIMHHDRIYVTEKLKDGGFSAFNAITPDGSRACGYITNTTNRGPIFRPFYCDITDGQLEDPVMLPCPDLDFFGRRAQYVLAGCISDDGRRIVGLVTDDSGGFSWPIIFTEDTDGNWTYSQPTEGLFNPDGLTLPNPGENPFANSEPKIADYMTAEEYAAYLEALAENPDSVRYWEFMTDEEYDRYYRDHIQWAEDFGNWVSGALQDDSEIMRRMGRDQHFGGILLISPDGNTMITAKMGVPYAFDLTDDSFAPLNIGSTGLTLSQMLSDGTFVGCSVTSGVPYISYVRRAGTDSFVKVTDYLEEFRRPYLYWLEDSFLNVGGGTIVTGLISFSDDMQAFCGGYRDGEGGAISYVFSGNELNGSTGVEAYTAEEDSVTVYTLSGVRLLKGADKGKLQSLPKGIYIVNGKKVKI